MMIGYVALHTPDYHARSSSHASEKSNFVPIYIGCESIYVAVTVRIQNLMHARKNSQEPVVPIIPPALTRIELL